MTITSSPLHHVKYRREEEEGKSVREKMALITPRTPCSTEDLLFAWYLHRFLASAGIISQGKEGRMMYVIL